MRDRSDRVGILMGMLLAVGFLFLTPQFSIINAAGHKKSLVYVGTYTDHGSKGIYEFTFDAKSGHLSPVGLAAETASPSYLALDPRHRFLYAVNEVPKYRGTDTGSVSAFAIESGTGKLANLNEVSSLSPGPAYVTVDQAGKYVLIASYDLGSVAAFRILGDGKLGESSSFIQHHGASVNAERQAGPHAHAIEMSPDNQFALVADLGLDEVLVYPFDSTSGKLGEPHVTKIAAGSGPRHLRFSKDGRFVYLINEMFSTITVFGYDAAGGTLSEMQTISTLPKGLSGEAAEIYLHPSGKFLYASNRGPDNIGVFAVDKDKGTLTPVEFDSTKGKTPRNFTLDPSGSWLLAANQDSNTIVTFRVDAKTGHLTPIGEVTQLASPVCITFDSASGERRHAH